RDLRTEIACARAHVAVGELKPRAGKRVRELTRMLEEASGDLFVGWIHPQREVRDQHGRRMTLRRVEGIRNRGVRPLRPESMRPSGALLESPFIFEQILEKAVGPFRRRCAPVASGPAGDRVFAFARAELALPAEALFLDQRTFRLRADKRGIAR